jgi:putative SOS response-associated peptidase YedK
MTNTINYRKLSHIANHATEHRGSIMCGRFVLKSKSADIASQFSLNEVPVLAPRYNIAPSQTIPTIRAPAGTRECVLARWGLIPEWSKEAKTEYSTFNARAETVSAKPAFRAAFRHRHCLIPADGFYEWLRSETSKSPYYISFADNQPFAFAGLWERWEKEGQAVESCTIIVTEANDLMRPIHDRMPVILAVEDYDRWLDPKIVDAARLQSFLKPCPSKWLQAYPVSQAVNNSRNEGAELIKPLPASLFDYDVGDQFKGYV